MKKVIVETSELKELLNSAKKYVSKDGIRPFYKNVKFECKKDSIRIVAISGYSLIADEVEVIKSNEFEIILPFFTIPKNAEKRTSIILKNKTITIDFGCYSISYKEVGEKFLDYKNIIREYKNNYTIRFNPKLLKEALEAFGSNVIELKFNLENNIEPVIITDVHKNKKQAMVLPCKKKEEE